MFNFIITPEKQDLGKFLVGHLKLIIHKYNICHQRNIYCLQFLGDKERVRFGLPWIKPVLLVKSHNYIIELAFGAGLVHCYASADDTNEI